MFSLSKPLCSFCRIAAFRPKPVRLQPKGLLQNENARANRTRNSKRAIKIGPREKRFCFSRGPIFCMIFCKAICNSLLFLFHANSYGLMVFVSHGFPTGRLFLFHAVFPQADRFFSHDFPAERFFFYPVSAERSFLFCSIVPQAAAFLAADIFFPQ